jgi:hypothetical protein
MNSFRRYIFSSWINHAGPVNGDTYQYITVPGIDATTLNSTFESILSSISITQNDASAQAVANSGIGL